MTDRMIQQGEPCYAFDDALDRVKLEIDRQLSRAPRIVGGFIGDLRFARGKYIRARLLLLSAQDDAGVVSDSAVRLAAAIEILHLATLVHDDVIDNADVRRGMPTLQKRFGRRTAVICGDYLLSLALKTASFAARRQEYLELDLPDFISRLAAGELHQHVNNGNLNLTVREYLRIISGKTAALFEACFLSGAMLRGEDGERRARYLLIGRYVGLIFQLMDDCLDFESDRDAAKKPVQSDFEQGVITLPLILAMEKSKEFKALLASGRASREEINRAVRAGGGIEDTRRLAERLYQKAAAAVDALGLPAGKREGLLAVIGGLTRRAEG